MFRSSHVVTTVSFLALLAILAACGGDVSSPTPDQPAVVVAESQVPESDGTVTVPSATGRGAGDTLKLFYWQAPTILNPHLSVGTKDQNASRIVYEPLASFDADGNMIPFLAAEIPSLENGGVAADGRSVTWQLRQDVVWADGTPFTSDDVLFTYEYITNPDVGAATAADYADIESVQAIDDHTIRIIFNDVNPAWSGPFVGVRGMIIPRHIFQDFAGANADESPANVIALGTGPYKVSEYIKEDVLIIGGDAVNIIRIVFEPNTYFREPDKPYFSRVELQGGGDSSVAVQAVLGDGVADFAWNVQVDQETFLRLAAGGKGQLPIPDSSFVEYVLINFTDPNSETAEGERSSIQFPHPFLTDKRVRQAIAHAIDRDAVHRLYGDAGPISTNVLTAPPQYRSSTTYPYPYDLERAATLLDAAGWRDTDGDGIRDKGGIRLSLVFQTSLNPVRQATQEVIKASLEQIGFAVALEQIDSSIFLGPVGDNTNTRRHFYADLEMFAYGSRSPDPGGHMKGWTCDQAAQMSNQWSTANWGRYCNPEYDELYAQSATELDPDVRRTLLIQMNDFLIEDVAVIPLVLRPLSYAVSNDLVGVVPTPWDVETWNIKDWHRP